MPNYSFEVMAGLHQTEIFNILMPQTSSLPQTQKYEIESLLLHFYLFIHLSMALGDKVRRTVSGMEVEMWG